MEATPITKLTDFTCMGRPTYICKTKITTSNAAIVEQQNGAPEARYLPDSKHAVPIFFSHTKKSEGVQALCYIISMLRA